MLDEQQFGDWCRKLGLSAQAENVIRQIRSSEPARLVRSNRGNVSGRYPSRKMGITIQFESHRNELAAIYDMEHCSTVLEFWDQPMPIKLKYRALSGRAVGVLHTPDFFVLRADSAGWEECKLEEDLRRLAESQPQRYCRTDDGKWCCPPGEDYARQFGLYYRLRSSAEINWVYQRNLIFLEDYLRAESAEISSEVEQSVRQSVSTQPGISLQELLRQDEAAIDAIYLLIATEKVYVNLNLAPLAEPGQVQVFADREVALAYAHINETGPRPSTHLIDLSCGALVSWDGRGWTIANVGERNIGLLGEGSAFMELSTEVFETLVRQAKITGLEAVTNSSQATVKELLVRAGPLDLTEANRRYKAIRPYLAKDKDAEANLPSRTIYRWLASYRQAERAYGNGYVGLLPRTSERGNRSLKLQEASRELMAEFITRDYESNKQKNKRSVYALLLRECEERGVMAPSYKTFAQAVGSRPHYEQTLKRQGARAAYIHEPFYFDLELTTPRHGDRPFEIVHLDHTELDIELICSRTGRNLGRPWASFLTDAFSRRLLAVILLYQVPSKVACMLTMRECVRRFGRLPQTLVVDSGREFQSAYFETLLACYECAKKTRPPAKSRFGSVVERLFGTTNTQFIYNLQGNTQSTRNLRQVTASVNPRDHAIWTLESLTLRLRQFAYEVYDTALHTTLGQSPREVFIQGLIRGGARGRRLIPYDEQFRMMSLPTTSKETATISPGKGVRLNYLYYWADAFRDPLVERTRVPVRYDPYDVGIAYAFVRKRWVRCISEHYRIFRGHSEQELLLAAAELHQRQRKMTSEGSITARRLANFLKSVEAEELLLTQRLRDAAVKQSLDLIESDSDLADTTKAIGQDSPYEGQGEMATNETSAESTSESDCRELLPDY
jgi:transposase InsO family protein